MRDNNITNRSFLDSATKIISVNRAEHIYLHKDGAQWTSLTINRYVVVLGKMHSKKYRVWSNPDNRDWVVWRKR